MVDTIFHTSCTMQPNTTNQVLFPIVWEKTKTKANEERGVPTHLKKKRKKKKKKKSELKVS
jgi:hypothetical protein